MNAVALAQDQRFTLEETDAWCRAKAGVDAWDLDVAACRESHLAERYFTVVENGLERRWDAAFVWCNPPFSDVGPWVRKAWAEMLERSGPRVVAMLLPGSRTEQPWWQEQVEPWRDRAPTRLGRDSRLISLATHYPPGRTRFGLPGNRRGWNVGSPPFACVLLVWTRHVQTSAHTRSSEGAAP